jgi:hypothetical protein
LQLPLKKSGGTAGILYNNRHRQAPRTHTDIQAVRALRMSEPILYILVYFEFYKIGGFVVQGIIIQN